MKTRHLIKLSKIIDKIEIKDALVSIEEDDTKEVAKRILGLLISNLYKAEKEIYEFVADYKGITIEEAENEDIIKLLTDVLDVDRIKDFL